MLQLEPQERVALPPVFLWEAWAIKSPSALFYREVYTSFSALYLCCFPYSCLGTEFFHSLLASCAAPIASNQYSWHTSELFSRSSKFTFARNWSSSSKVSDPTSCWAYISLCIYCFWAMQQVPDVESCSCMHLYNHRPWVNSSNLIIRPLDHCAAVMADLLTNLNVACKFCIFLLIIPSMNCLQPMQSCYFAISQYLWSSACLISSIVIPPLLFVYSTIQSLRRGGSVPTSFSHCSRRSIDFIKASTLQFLLQNNVWAVVSFSWWQLGHFIFNLSHGLLPFVCMPKSETFLVPFWVLCWSCPSISGQTDLLPILLQNNVWAVVSFSWWQLRHFIFDFYHGLLPFAGAILWLVCMPKSETFLVPFWVLCWSCLSLSGQTVLCIGDWVDEISFLWAFYVPRIFVPLLYPKLICYNPAWHRWIPVGTAAYAYHLVVLSPILIFLHISPSGSSFALGVSDLHSSTCHLGVI